MSSSPLVVFDLDGTLVDSRRDLADSVNDLIRERGRGPLAEAAVGRMVGDGASMLVARAFDAVRLPPDPGALGRFLDIYNARLLEHTVPYPGIVDLLGELGKRATLAVLTNKPIAATRTVLAGLALSGFFAPGKVRGGDGPNPCKPDPSGLLQLASEAGVAPADVVMVGDSVVDWLTARAAGTRICMVSWGFGFEVFPQAELRPDEHVIASPAELLTLV